MKRAISFFLSLILILSFSAVVFADDYATGDGSSRGGGVGRIRDGLVADISAAPRKGDLVCNSCGAEYSSSTTLPIDFKCPTCGEDFFSISKVRLKCWSCGEYSSFVIDDITSATTCPSCGTYMSTTVKQGEKTGYAYKTGGGSSRGGGVGRHKDDTTTVVLPSPDSDADSAFSDAPSDANDLDTWSPGHGMIKLQHAFSFNASLGVTERGGWRFGAYTNRACEHYSAVSDLATAYNASLAYGDSGFPSSNNVSNTNYDVSLIQKYTCDDDRISYSGYTVPYHGMYDWFVFYCIAPESGYYWVSHYPHAQCGKFPGKLKFSYDKNYTITDRWFVRDSSSAGILSAVSLPYDSDTDFPCSDTIGYSNCLTNGSSTNDMSSVVGIGSDTLRSPCYYDKGDYIFFTAKYRNDFVPPSGVDAYAIAYTMDYPYVSYVPANLGGDGSSVYYDWQFDPDDETYVLITYPDPIERKSYDTVISYDTPETPDTSDSECCDHTGIIAVLEQIRDYMVEGFNKTLQSIQTSASSFSADITVLKTTLQTEIQNVTSNLYEFWEPKITSITSSVSDLQASIVAGFQELVNNFQLSIDKLILNINTTIDKKLPDLPDPTPTPTPDPTPTPSPEPTPSPSPSPNPSTPVIPDTQNYIIPTMTANSYTDSHGTWIASGSSYAEERFAYYNAFNPDGFWVNGRGNQAGAHGREMPCWLQIEIPDPESYYIDGYTLKCGPDDNFDVWQILGSNDGETWEKLDAKSESLADDDEHKYPLTLHKAYKYYRLYIEHFSDYMGVKSFNLLGYDAADVVIPSPTPDPGETPTPTPAPTDKPDSGDTTNNFWTIIFPNAGNESDGSHKGIFWALVSLILALVTFFVNMAAGYKYLFPFLPDGVVMTIHVCLFVLFLFVIIKFIMRSK